MFHPKNYHIHFVGIGGIGMSAIAEILMIEGYQVSGSDIRSTPLTERLSKSGATIYYGHEAHHVKGADVLVYSTAVHSDNCEIASARTNHIPVIHRAQLLAEIVSRRFSIAVTGSHGKTSTTAIVGEILSQADLNPSIILGGILNKLSTNAKSGKGNFIVVEADESDGSLLNLYPSIAIITNVDHEHMDHYGTIEKVCQAFLTFANRPPFYGATVLCADDPVLRSFIPKMSGKCLTYGIENSADVMAKNIKQTAPSTMAFDLVYQNRDIEHIQLNLAGVHNVLNALASIAACRILDIPWSVQKKALTLVEGVQRRMDIRGKRDQVLVMDDYGHHPTEIIATLKAIKAGWPDRQLCVLFQPHRYTRTRDLFDDFANAFDLADQLVILPIYSAGEAPIENIDSQHLCQAMKKNLSNRVACAETFEQAIDLSVKNQKTLLLTLGAGDIRKAGDLFLKWIDVNA
ncbi:MAG: UDP-N-acetylmuramate--L-alanine ligase [Candidatus Magnetomorum sp.]|nr:UDP-N-acetylmuramate--L-alanine ligase [Candidatus Magnetomorum sp.]